MPLTENVFIELEYDVSSYLSFNNHNTFRTWGWDKIFAMFDDSKWFPPAMTRMSKICLLFLLSSSCVPNIQGKGAFKHGAAPGDGENISLPISNAWIPSWLECLLVLDQGSTWTTTSGGRVGKSPRECLSFLEWISKSKKGFILKDETSAND